MNNKETHIQLMTKVNQGKNLFDQLQSSLSEDTFFGEKTFLEWKEVFHVDMPETDADPGICKAIALNLANLYQEASHYYSKAMTCETIAIALAKSALKDGIRSIISDCESSTPKKRIPGEKALLQQAESQETVADASMRASIASAHKEFFKNVIDRLSTCRKIIENISINNAVEAKMEQGTNNISQTPDRN